MSVTIKRTGNAAAWALAVWVLAAGAASAGEAPEGSSSREARVLTTRLVEAARAGRWAAASKAWFDLLEEQESPPTRLRMLAARVQVELGRTPLAKDLLLDVLEAEPDRIGALFLLARLEARTQRPQRARELLLLAARAGQAVLADLDRDDEPAFAPLRRDPRFLLSLMRAHEGDAKLSSKRDPFNSPVRALTAEERVKEPKPKKDAVLARLGARFRLLLTQAKTQAEARDVDGLQATLQDLRGVMDECEARSPGSAERWLEEQREDFADAEQLFVSLQLQLYVARGNHLLRLIAQRISEAKFDLALRAADGLEAVCKSMERSDQALMTQSARRLRQRGLELRRNARVLKTIDELELRVSGIVIPPPSSDEARRVIVNDRIVARGQALLSDQGASTGIVVERVERSAVTFRYRGVRFVRVPETKPKR